VNGGGVLVSHPKYTLKDDKNLTGADQGELAVIVKNRMLK